MSAYHVLSIIEVLQQILGELPPLDIIRCQRVNRTWKQLIANSPLLQYQAWLRNDCSDPAYRIQPDDLIIEYHGPSKETDNSTDGFIRNVAQHLHPIVVVNIMKHLPEDTCYSFDPVNKIDTDGFGGYLNLRPVLLRDLMQWYEKHKTTTHIWGNMPLYRPDARKVCWEIPDSEGAGIPVHLEAIPNKAGTYNPNHSGRDFKVNKAPGQPLVLTVGDLMRKLDYAWSQWMDSERENHYLSHDTGVCDLNQGIPDEYCLGSEDEDEDDGGKRRAACRTKLTMAEHIQQAIEAASA